MIRPKVNLQLSTIDKTFEIVGWMAFLCIWILIIVNYHRLPNSIPIHYNGKGEVDGFGGKTSIIILPTIASFLFVGMTYLNKFPHLFNYPTNITDDNAPIQYTYATRLIRYLKTIIVIIFGWSTLQTIRGAIGSTNSLGVWLFPMMSGLIFIPIVYFVVKSMNAK
ncbi:MAG: hypothetical protein DI598_16400 [Pseudopedobacter saltans]|uniref:DUF1648 domain-containing protein n=1 Tax=Pseudopedobacter saltans TaxID=151895 RepID=A0A2W5EIH4_9SPHI|nr:MAG: hypothetical protein DI598_16400 [Pseudopedobacter saltans]